MTLQPSARSKLSLIRFDKSQRLTASFVSSQKTPRYKRAELSQELMKDLAEAAEAATQGYAKFGSFLEQELLPGATVEDAIGRERYELLSMRFLGTKVDLDEAYEWGKEELARIVAEQALVAEKILPGRAWKRAITYLEKDPSTKLHGTKALQEWMQQLSDAAVAAFPDTL